MSGEKKAAKEPKFCRPPIPGEMIDRLIDRYSMPVTSMPDEGASELWVALAALKGWIEKQGDAPTDPNGFRHAAWHKIRGILDEAVEANNPAPFDAMSKEWLKMEIDKSPPRLNQTSKKNVKNLWASPEQKTVEARMETAGKAIEGMLPALPKFTPNAPRKVKFLEAIASLQRRLKRAPTRREIEDYACLEKSKVGDYAQEMGLGELLSRARTPVK